TEGGAAGAEVLECVRRPVADPNVAVRIDRDATDIERFVQKYGKTGQRCPGWIKPQKFSGFSEPIGFYVVDVALAGMAAVVNSHCWIFFRPERLFFGRQGKVSGQRVVGVAQIEAVDLPGGSVA